jgi:dTDP-4-dehydrorhamnose 3,5-epimerase
MIFNETMLKGAFLIEPEKLEDERGFFARTWCSRELAERGLKTGLAQCNISFNKKKGTLRGMHYQAAPHGETKLVRCTSGSVYDVIIDLRYNSETYKQWFATKLSAKNYKMLYIPEDFAHGFLTLEDNTEVQYQMSEFYYPDYARGIRWNDPAFCIKWPQEICIVSKRDFSYPDFK